MFANTKAFSAFAIDDLAQARKFYGQTLGVRVSDQHGLLTLHLAGGRDTRVYPKPDHTPAIYSILNFEVDDIEAAAGEDIFPDPMSQFVAEGWRNSAAKAFEHQLAALAQGISSGRN